MGISRVVVGILASAVLAGGCNSQNGPDSGPSGGTGGGGTPTSSGGSPATGGASGAGGTTTTTSATASGGATSVGGNTAGGSGGASGMAATGGARASGGAVTTGGSGARGGATSTGGASAMGGASGTGGTAATGGSKATGGATSRGGANSSDGGNVTGGVTSAGAATSTGGRATGGAGGTGGTTGRTCGTTAASLRAAADCTGRLIGVALAAQHLSEGAYTTAAKEFNYVTAENEMKWDQIEPTRNQFTWGNADQIVKFATDNGMKVKGHTLVWYNQLPSWVSGLTSAAEVRAAMLAHIKAVMQHYKGKVAVWDVVNEAVSIEGTSYRDCPFYKYLGKTYIDEAFQAAREADPDAKLYYNDYNDEGLNAKSDFVYELLKDMVSRGVPIDGVGMQMHYGTPNASFTLADLTANIQRLVDLGLEVVYSEMDMHMCSGMTTAEQVALYHDLIAACMAQPLCKAVTFWGITDKYSWLNSYAPLGCSGSQKPLGDLWDDNFKKKPAYTGVLNALLGL